MNAAASTGCGFIKSSTDRWLEALFAETAKLPAVVNNETECFVVLEGLVPDGRHQRRRKTTGRAVSLHRQNAVGAHQ